MTDVAVTLTPAGYYDIGLGADGDLLKQDSMETAIEISLFGERRADISQVPEPFYRRGWVGNTVSSTEGFEQGSLLWLLEQARVTPENARLAATFAEQALSWMVDDAILQAVTAVGSITAKGIRVAVKLTRFGGQTTTRYYDLWENTTSAS